MGEASKIEWTDHTFNPWIGCQKIAPGCAHCYAESFWRRYGAMGTRIKTSEANWRKPLAWDRAAAKAGIRPRVFCSSLADVFDDWPGQVIHHSGRYVKLWRHMGTDELAAGVALDDPTEFRPCTLNDLRRDLFNLIDRTPNLDWLLLTKRPDNVLNMWPLNRPETMADLWGKRAGFPGGADASRFRPNAWLGTSISDQKTAAKNLPQLINCRGLASVLFVSAEPLLNFVDLSPWLRTKMINWVIVGGESGHDARACDLDHVTSLVQQCRRFGVACFVKQLGYGTPLPGGDIRKQSITFPGVGADVWFYHDKKGGNPAEWPDFLRVRQWPEVAG